jgi:outer membrane protein TolC
LNNNSWGETKDKLDLKYCYQKARALSPLKKQELLNQSIHDLNDKNSGGSYRPTLYLSGKASYQSDVIAIPGLSMVPEFPVIPKEQFNLNINLQQHIYDGGKSKHSRQINESQLLLSEMDLETQLYKINETINTIYFTILNLQESLKILNNTLDNLNQQKSLIASRVKNGLLLESNLYNLEKQILSIEQNIISVESDHYAMREMLSEWIGQEVSETTELLIPALPELNHRLPINRPEIKLFRSQRELLDAQYGLSNLSRTPKIWAFAQGGLGQPNPMNFFEVDPSTYYIFGIQLNWDIYDWGNTSRKKQIYQMQQAIVDSKQEDFERNLHIAMIRNYQGIEKLEEILKKDNEIIALQDKIVKSAFSELQNGVITSTEYLTELNILIRSKIQRAQHEIGLAQTYVNIYTSTGNNL